MKPKNDCISTGFQTRSSAPLKILLFITIIICSEGCATMSLSHYPHVGKGYLSWKQCMDQAYKSNAWGEVPSEPGAHELLFIAKILIYIPSAIVDMFAFPFILFIDLCIVLIRGFEFPLFRRFCCFFPTWFTSSSPGSDQEQFYEKHPLIR